MVIQKYILPFIFFIIFLLIWQFLVSLGILHAFIIPGPLSIFETLIKDRNLIIHNALITSGITLLGVFFSIITAFFTAIALDTFTILKNIFYPIILMLQIIPILIFAPLLVLLLGYGIKTQLIIVTLMCFFPILISLLRGFESTSTEYISLLQSMGATQSQIFYWIKFPSALFSMLSGLRIAITYSITASIISEWVSSINGLGVIMIKSQKSFLIERVFAINVVILILSFFFYSIVVFIEKSCMPWKKTNIKSTS